MVVDLRKTDVLQKPFAHVMRESFVDPDAFRVMRETFPECPPSTGPTGFSLYWGDGEYDQLLRTHRAWQELFDSFHSQKFIDWAIDQFADVWRDKGCRIDLSKARYVPYRESREDKERRSLARVEHEPHELWVRMDIHQGRVGYSRAAHLDHRRRLLSMLVYVSGQDESQMVGGELLLHGPRWRRLIESPVMVPPRPNLMVAFPCSTASWHSVPRIRSMARPRNYLQIQISSSMDAW